MSAAIKVQMEIRFPDNFHFGTSTSAYQIETAFEHDWDGHIARDGSTFRKTTDHEKEYREDVEIIASLAPNYRMSLMWSKLQRQPYALLEPGAAAVYHDLLQHLCGANVDIMMVLHHFGNPLWFSENGGWANKNNVDVWVDYAKKVVDEYGRYVTSWNTFNEPNLYTSMGWLTGEFPPYQKNMLLATRVIGHLGKAHEIMYHYIKERFPETMVGISHNCAVFAADNLLGKLPAAFCDAVYMRWVPELFRPVDFFGMSYYARIGYDPFPSTYLLTPGKFHKKGKAHDDLWEYFPEGLGQCIERYWRLYGKPIIITENGISTSDDQQRVAAIYDYLSIVHNAISKGIDIRGYYHWTAWDNFEWSVGPSYRFGLYGFDTTTGKKFKKPSADVFSGLAHTRKLLIPADRYAAPTERSASSTASSVTSL